jgi:hypothetical protein
MCKIPLPLVQCSLCLLTLFELAVELIYICASQSSQKWLCFLSTPGVTGSSLGGFCTDLNNRVHKIYGVMQPVLKYSANTDNFQIAIKHYLKPDVVACTCNHSTWEVKAGGLRVQSQPRPHNEIVSQK